MYNDARDRLKLNYDVNDTKCFEMLIDKNKTVEMVICSSDQDVEDCESSEEV